MDQRFKPICRPSQKPLSGRDSGSPPAVEGGSSKGCRRTGAWMELGRAWGAAVGLEAEQCLDGQGSAKWWFGTDSWTEEGDCQSSDSERQICYKKFLNWYIFCEHGGLGNMDANVKGHSEGIWVSGVWEYREIIMCKKGNPFVYMVTTQNLLTSI